MARSLFLIFLLVITGGLIYFLDQGLIRDKMPIPAFGKILNPHTGFWKNGETQTLDLPEELQFKGLSKPAQVIFDDRMVPHIFAENIKDAAFVQGYVHAYHRLWQMEFQTHAAAGRLTEILGEIVLKQDQETRRIGIPYAANNALEEWKKDQTVYSFIESYSNGVNAYIDQLSPADYPIEYKLLNYKPEAWTPLKSALLQKLMARMLAMRESDLENTNTKNTLGATTFDQLFPEWFEEQDPIIPKGTVYPPSVMPAPTDTTNLNIGGVYDHDLIKKYDPHLGSNNWAVSGSMTASGHPILCNDPHLMLTAPSTWYECQIHIPESNTYGVSLPGSPGIIIGFNEHIAWGVTNVGWDLTDWYKITWEDNSRKAYLYDGKYVPSRTVIEEYQVKGQGILRDTVYYTHWGPVAYLEKDHPYQDMAIQWVGHLPSNEATTFYHLNKAKNYTEYADAIKGYATPPQNFAFASKENDIALWVQGQFPMKNSEQGRFVQDGSKSASAWKGFIPQSHNPHIKNPERGFVSSANQHSAAPDYPYYFSGRFGDYRGRILNQKLGKMDSITIQDMMDLQTDNENLRARQMLPLLLQYLDKSNLTENDLAYLKTFAGWDYRFEKDMVAPSLFDAWFDAFYDITWDEIEALDFKGGKTWPKWWRTIHLLRDEPNSVYFDVQKTTEKETANDVVTSSFKKACKKLSEWSKKENKEPLWGPYKATDILHLSRVIKPFAFTNIDVGGDRTALNAISKHNGPSWRMIVELGEEIEAYGIYPGGQSGNPGSPNYGDFIDKWAKGEYYKLWFMKNAKDDKQKPKATMTFNPS